MAFDGSTNCWYPNKYYSVARERRLRIAQFGDGYEQRIVDGLNSMAARWSLTFDLRPSDIILAMDQYLADQEGHAFPFLDPVTDATVQVFCDDWTYAWEYKRTQAGVASVYGTLTAEFRQAFGATLAATALTAAEALDVAAAEAAAEAAADQPRPTV